MLLQAVPMLFVPSAGWAEAAAEPLACEVAVREGRLRGARRAGVDAFRGVPYAGGVSGKNRFLRAQPAAPWKGVRDALKLGPGSVQPDITSWALDEPPASEECLVLNVWAPTARRDLPVMFYCHGGGISIGSGGSIYADGTNLARSGEVVVVTVNHRLGLLGFLDLEALGGEAYAGSANRGLEDLTLALAWVRENIAAFGGNPDNITLFGESGGAVKVSCLVSMPSLAPAFARASVESGPTLDILSKAQTASNTERLLAHLGLGRDNWRALLAMPAKQIIAAQNWLATVSPDADYGGQRGIASAAFGGLGPSVDGRLIPDPPFSPPVLTLIEGKPLIVGGTRDEEEQFAIERDDLAAFRLDEACLAKRLRVHVGDSAPALIAACRRDRPNASPSEVFIAVRSALFSGLGTREIAERRARTASAATYVYEVDYKVGGVIPGTDFPVGAPHALDLPLKFGNVDPPPISMGLLPIAGIRPERVAAARAMCSYWSSFAHAGVPSAAAQPDWPRYDERNRPTMRIDSRCLVISDPDPAQRHFWDQHP